MHKIKSGYVVSLLLAAAMGVGCASAPPAPIAELSEATALIQQADSAGAGQFAPGPLGTARSEMTRAQGLSEDGKQEEAKVAAQRATADARLAIAATERAKAEKAAADSDAALQALRKETQRQ